ncbi:hypothetical protein ACFSNA_17480 [Pedobacter mendelii]
MNCPKGDVVSIIIDPVIAMAAAKEITSNNNAQINAHLASQAVIGVITAATAFTPIGLLVAAPIPIVILKCRENSIYQKMIILHISINMK